jgi:hypothetical protein
MLGADPFGLAASCSSDNSTVDATDAGTDAATVMESGAGADPKSNHRRRPGEGDEVCSLGVFKEWSIMIDVPHAVRVLSCSHGLDSRTSCLYT